MLPIWASHYHDIETLKKTWQLEFEKRASGGAIALAGFHYQFLVTIHDTLRTWLDLPTFERSRPRVLAECLSDILHKASNDVVLITQVKRTSRSNSFQDALTELWLIYNLALKITPALVPYLRFRILSSKSDLKNVERALSHWQPDKQYSDRLDLEVFRQRVVVQLFSDPEDEVLALLANDLRATDPVGYLHRWLGKLISAARREGTVGFEDAADAIWNDLQSIENSSLTVPPSIYVWTSQDKAPDNVVEGEVLTGERPHVHHLRQGYFASRPAVYQPIVDQAQKWIDELTDNWDKQLRLPVFWIGGRSGSGKSVALMHVLALLYESGLGPILWLGNKTDLLRQAIPWALKLAAKNRQVIIGIDDPYAPNTQGDDVIWKEALAVLESVRQGGDASALPLIFCCGPTEQAERMQMDLPEDVNVNLSELPEEDQKDIFQLRSWYVQRTKKVAPKIGDDNILLVQLFFEWETGLPLPEFASRFRNRIRESDSGDALEDIITRILSSNRLYVGYPAIAVSKYLTPELQDVFRRLREEHHIAYSSSDYGTGLWLAHPHLSNVIYESWYPFHRYKAVRLNHLNSIIKDGFEFGSSPSEKTASLWAISHATFGYSEQSSLVGRLNQETIINLLPSVYTSRTQDSGERLPLAELPVWIQLHAMFPEVVLSPDPVNEALGYINVDNIEERGLRLSCHKLLQHYNAFPEYQQHKILDSITQLLTEARYWYEWAPIADDAYRRIKDQRFVHLIIDWVSEHPQSNWAERLFTLIFNNNSADTLVVNKAKSLLPLAGGGTGWGDIAIRLIEESELEIPLAVLEWAKNNCRHQGSCYLLGRLLSIGVSVAIEWAMTWCETWHRERSANYVLEPLLAFTGPDEKVKNWCIRWVATDHRHVSDGFLVEKMISTFPSDTEVQSVALKWLANSTLHKSWLYVWTALYKVDPQEGLTVLSLKTESTVTAHTSIDSRPGQDGLRLGANPTATTLNPGYVAEAWYSVAIAYRKARREEDSIKAFAKATELNPLFSKAWQALGAVYSRMGQVDLALQATLKVIELIPDDAEAFYNLAVAYGKAERHEDQVAALIRATELDPQFAKAWQALGFAYSRLGQTDLALKALLKAIELKPDDAKAWNSLAIFYDKAERYEDQLAALIRATELKPRFAKAWQALGFAYNRLGQIDLALQAFLKITEIAPNFADAWKWIWIAYGQLGQPDLALQAALKVTELKPDDAEAHYHLALAYGKEGRSEEKIASLIRVTQLNPQFAKAWQALGFAYSRLGQTDLALKALLKAIELKPDDAEAWNSLAIFYDKAERYEDQVAALIRATELKPRFAKAWQALGFAYNRLGQIDLALQATLKATEFMPDDANAWYYLAVAYGKANRYEDEIIALVRATELNPYFVDAWKELQHIYYKLRRYSLAVETSNTLLEISPDAIAWSNLGLTYFRMRRFKDAAIALTKATTLKTNLTFTQQILDETLAIIDAFERPYIEPEGLNTEDSRKFYSLARQYVESGKYTEALNAFYEALNASTDKSKATFTLLQSLLREATVAFHSESYEKAILLLKIIISIDPTIADAWSFLSSSYRRTGNDEEALKATECLVRLNPTSAEAWYKLGKRYAVLGRTNDAVEAFNRVLQLNPNFNAARRQINKLVNRID